MTFRDQLANLMQIALLAIVSVLATWGMANPVDVKAIDDNRPQNAPSYASAVHREAAGLMCQVETGKAGIIPSGNDVVAAYVVVVRLEGVMVRMDTTEAWDRARSKKEADNVWVIGVCRADVQNRAVKA